jgi:putative oxidoreductase
MNALLLVGRLILGGFFLFSGINHFLGFAMMTQYAKMKGVPFPAFAQGLTGVMLLAGGLSVLFGIYPIVGVILMVAFLLPVSFMMHNFWTIEDPQLRMADRINFLKNIALVGALLMLLAIPSPWALSLVP